MPRLAGWFGLSAVVVVLDQISKTWIAGRIEAGTAIRLGAYLDLVHVYNPGAAFSFLSDASGWQRWLFVALAGAISIWLIALIGRHRAETAAPLAFALILGGAIGNLIDRLMHGAVLDFLYFHVGTWGWPAFNVADSAISAGVVLILLVRARRRTAG
ncbi:MAG TPA: signal peptidase II [Rhodocyclaceae bacterium]|nr:MAG: signal peptidase II [Betaproteobacteria bacterium CG2_30_68_42]PIV71685.1 MAG: signal peptidase II [Rhodocyclales bacterium CG17_big_fil_post_rev_8_21_14_2_50_68_7]PIX75391.1 MAG: signal peptidase II [Rhodocyclales bacterium CG_4_10_14_3_um_filter_68_10]PJA57761.1 MAG: signal peptidase II [Rhodocyclales bacterium CG_4_9_14_3_um_filter_68_10]HCX34355.1 signal peptidase II [Rhodocyclaceae bacterium]